MRRDADDMVLPLPGGQTELGLAIKEGRSPAFVRILLQDGAMVNMENAWGSTPLQTLLNEEPERQAPAFGDMPAFGAMPALVVMPYLRASQARLVDIAILLLQAGAEPPKGEVVVAKGNEACAVCVDQYWNAVKVMILRRGISSRQLDDDVWGGVIDFLYQRR